MKLRSNYAFLCWQGLLVLPHTSTYCLVHEHIPCDLHMLARGLVQCYVNTVIIVGFGMKTLFPDLCYLHSGHYQLLFCAGMTWEGTVISLTFQCLESKRMYRGQCTLCWESLVVVLQVNFDLPHSQSCIVILES